MGHCNLRCLECSHLSPYVPHEIYDLNDFIADIKVLEQTLQLQYFKFVGGEPTLNRQIVDFILAVRQSQIAQKIIVSTNGVTLFNMSDEFFKALDILEISAYPGTLVGQKHIEFAKEKGAEFQKEILIHDKHIFRRTQTPYPHPSEQILQQIYDSCAILQKNNVIHHGYYYKCSRPIFTNYYLQAKGIQGTYLPEKDGISIYQPHFRDRLISYLQRGKPLAACQYCLGTVGKSIEHRQMTKEELHAMPAHFYKISQIVYMNQMRKLARYQRWNRNLQRFGMIAFWKKLLWIFNKLCTGSYLFKFFLKRLKICLNFAFQRLGSLILARKEKKWLIG
ncbi:MAG: 4Fe-4S cluster-binding domain-containing protein [Candidatus Brocadiae bacterium]|nr:4Fe-4S cluster-binding domain-containing protein [Candidatus Brocadiia bacterium]